MLLFSTTADVKRSKFPRALRAKRMMTNAPKYCFLHPPPQDRRNCTNRKGEGKVADYAHPILPKRNAFFVTVLFLKEAFFGSLYLNNWDEIQAFPFSSPRFSDLPTVLHPVTTITLTTVLLLEKQTSQSVFVVYYY